jgi:hypothetical protein
VGEGPSRVWFPRGSGAEAPPDARLGGKAANLTRLEAWGSPGAEQPLKRPIYPRLSGEVIEILLASGADKDLKNNYGISPLDLAGTIANFDAMQFLG